MTCKMFVDRLFPNNFDFYDWNGSWMHVKLQKSTMDQNFRYHIYKNGCRSVSRGLGFQMNLLNLYILSNKFLIRASIILTIVLYLMFDKRRDITIPYKPSQFMHINCKYEPASFLVPFCPHQNFIFNSYIVFSICLSLFLHCVYRRDHVAY